MMTGHQTNPKATILAATDLSSAADEAIRQGHAWAVRANAEFAICHVIPAHHRANPLFPQRNEVESIGAVEFERRVAEIIVQRVSELTGRQAGAFRVAIDVGRPDASILRIASQMQAGLIVIGDRGETDLATILLGGVSTSVVRRASCSVLVARPTSARGRVLVTTDLSDPSLPAIRIGAAEARRRDAKLLVLHNLDIWPHVISVAGTSLGPAGMGPDQAQELRERGTRLLRELLARQDVEGECLVTTGAPDAEIVRAADRLQPELLVIGTHGRTGLSRLALGSVAERVIEAANCPVLVVRLEVASVSD